MYAITLCGPIHTQEIPDVIHTLLWEGVDGADARPVSEGRMQTAFLTARRFTVTTPRGTPPLDLLRRCCGQHRAGYVLRWEGHCKGTKRPGELFLRRPGLQVHLPVAYAPTPLGFTPLLPLDPTEAQRNLATRVLATLTDIHDQRLVLATSAHDLLQHSLRWTSP